MLRPAAAILAAAAFALPIVFTLGTTVPAVKRISLGVDDRAAGVAADLRGRWSVEPDGTFYLPRIDLRTTDPERLLQHELIAFEVLQYEGLVDMQDATLAFDGTECVYRARPDWTFATDGMLTFRRTPGCVTLQGTPTGTMRLTLRLRSQKPVALRAAVRDDEPPGAVVISKFGMEGMEGVLLARGTLADAVPNQAGARRLTLLAYVWKLSESSAWIVLMLAGAAAAIGASALLVRSRPAAAMFLFALALSSTYAVMLPPFQGADEPNHFLTLAGALGRPELAFEGAAWARRAHFEELRTTGRAFTPVDRGNPGQPWIGVQAPDAMRGGGASALWWLLTPVLANASAPRVLLTLRLFHALLFAGAVGLFVLAIARWTDTRRPELLTLALFLVPTLPYFGMHMSNYAPLVGFYVLFAAGALVALWDGPKSYWAAPLIAAPITIGMALARSAVPLAGLAAAIAAARIVLGDREGRRQHSLMYWTLLTGTAIVGLSLVNLAYPEGPERGLIRYDIAHGRIAWLLHHPWWLVLPGAALAGVEVAIAPLVRRLSAPSATRDGIVSVTAYMAAIAVAVWVFASPWLTHPTAAFLKSVRVTTLDESIRDIVPALLAWPRFGQPDTLTSVTFWGGFGWLEKLLPAGLVSALAGASGLAGAALLAWVGRRRSGRALFWIACAAAGYVVSAIAYAYTARLIFTDVHGRYLLGLYLAVLAIVWSVVARWSDEGRPGRSTFVTGLAAACVIVLHAWTITHLLDRYFF